MKGPGFGAAVAAGVALAAIRLYQRFVSPYKGFGCAYRLHTGCASCSTLGYRAIRRHGLFTGLGLLDQRLDRCGEAWRQHTAAARRLSPQAGLCDLSCDLPCDLDCSHGMPKGLSHCASSACDASSCGSCDGCKWRDCRDWRDRHRQREPSRRRQQRSPDKWVRIPPTHQPRRPD